MSCRRASRDTYDASLRVAEYPFSHLLHSDSDKLPSLQEKKVIQELLAQQKAHLSQLNSKVPRRRTGKKIPRQLRADLDRTRRFIRVHQVLIAPWRWLPVEIMSEIFLFTLSPRESEDTDSWNDDRRGTLLLCKICRTWRNITISTPALWNVLSLNLHAVEHRVIDLVSTWLDRSRSFPVYLQVFWDHTAFSAVVNSVISTFALHLHHTAGLWIDGLDMDDPEFALLSPKPTFPPVESPRAPFLATLSVDLPPGSNWDWIHSICRAAPYLAHLTTPQFSAADWFPLTNLISVHFILPITIFDVLQLLEHAPGLKDVSVDVTGPAVASPTRPPLVLHALSQLEVTSHQHFGQFLDQITVPHLEKLWVHQIVDWPAPEFQAFLSRSSCVLRALDFADVEISEDNIIACLKHKACSRLEALAVTDCDPPASALLQYLTYRAPAAPGVGADHCSDPNPNPHLEEIELGNILAVDGFLSSLVRSRLTPSAPVAVGPESHPLSPAPEPAPAPARLGSLRFSFVEGTASSQVTHARDWADLRELEWCFPEFKLIWPQQDE
ncbi:hypothetical protein GGX14DRAFT_652980 [Mycena pura]|uniref:F-box domain-containing protein n=1 Tax=Mycena pura TaxID=153505 RepID=A0AAD6V575_9AGAR|nr:hypothetical protein GGX14DRAFT_652980 [Mycena pura]